MDFSTLKKDLVSIDVGSEKHIPDYAFSSFYNLTKVSLPDTVESIGRSAFQNCQSLKEVKLPDSLTEIPNNLFLNCRKLEKVIFPSKLLKIGDQAFFGTGLKSIVIPESVVTIGNSAFTGITEFSIRDGFNYQVNKYNIFNWLSEPIYDREADGKIPETYTFIKNVVVSVYDDIEKYVKFKFLIPFNDKFDFFSISHEIFINNRLDLGLLDRQFQMIRDFENKINYVYYRILYPYKLTDDNKKLFERFIVANAKNVAEKFILKDEVDPIIKLMPLNLVNDSNIDMLIDFANQNRKFNVLSYLMNYKNEHYSERYKI